MLNWFVHRVVYQTPDLDFSLHFTSRATGVKNLVLGRNVWYSLAMNGGAYIQALNGIEIGDDTLIASGLKIVSADHDVADHRKHVPAEPIRLGKRCWIGTNVVILPGVQLGDEVVVAAGSVVTRSFESRSVVAGVPAALIKKLEIDGDVVPLLQS